MIFIRATTAEPEGERTYELWLNEFVFAEFKHDPSFRLASCLRRAAAAVDREEAARAKAVVQSFPRKEPTT